jgi:hypothetical protein
MFVTLLERFPSLSSVPLPLMFLHAPPRPRSMYNTR